MKFLKWLLVLLVLVGGLYFFYRYEFGPFGSGRDIYIPKGSNFSQVALQLQKEGVVRSSWVFKILLRIKGAPGGLKPGEYEFPASMTPEAVLDKILRGERVVHKLVIPEGYNFNQMAQAIDKAGIAPAAEVIGSFQDPLLIKKLGFPAVSLEGYLFPATYEYDRGTQLNDLLLKMIDTFQKNFSSSMREQTQAAGWTIPQVVTLASIIEKETAQAAERPVISGVFHNRLRIGMKLETDPTVIYGLTNYDGKIHKADLSNPHPYNTYVHPGLPPGPIASPGKESLKAVLNPAQSSYLYFVSKGDGTHYFSSTFEEHQAAVQQYQLGRTESRPMGPAATPKPESQPLLKTQ